MSIFEAIMLVCFGAAWPFSIYRSYKSCDNSGKSLGFMLVILIGYISGIIHKIYFHYDLVILLYIVNSLMVTVDISLYFRNKCYMEEKTKGVENT